MLRYTGFFQSKVTLKYRVYIKFYLIKIKRVLANSGSEKQLQVEKAYFITTEIDLIGEKQPFLTNTPFLNEDKVKFLQINKTP